MDADRLPDPAGACPTCGTPGAAYVTHVCIAPVSAVVSPADTIRRAITLSSFSGDAHGALDVLLAERERDKAEIEWLADRAVCSVCGSDVGESGVSGVCPYPDCEDGEIIPASDLPSALRAKCDRRVEERDEEEEPSLEPVTDAMKNDLGRKSAQVGTGSDSSVRAYVCPDCGYDGFTLSNVRATVDRREYPARLPGLHDGSRKGRVAGGDDRSARRRIAREVVA